MKKNIYYVLPFIILPVILVLCEILNTIKFIKMSPLVLVFILIIYSGVSGYFSTTSNKFDTLISIINPLALFVTMFFVGFFDSTETYSKFNFYIGIKTAVQFPVLAFNFIIAVISFIFSNKRIRRNKMLKEDN